jgi:hypothetical protein
MCFVGSQPLRLPRLAINAQARGNLKGCDPTDHALSLRSLQKDDGYSKYVFPLHVIVNSCYAESTLF